MKRPLQLLIALSQLTNVLIGSGWADESLSSYGHRTRGFWRALINSIFFWQADHCASAHASEVEQRQLPPGLRR